MQKYQVAEQNGGRKFLKAIYDIQEKFGVKFAGVSRTFSFGIKPTPEMQVRLEEWFRQVGAVKAELYGAIFEDFRATPDKYLGQKFNYATFFKGSAFARANKQYPFLTSEPVGEGLRMEISIPSFITNHKRRFDEAGISARTLKEQIESNNHELDRLDIEMDFESNVLLEKLGILSVQKYEDIIKTYEKLQAYEKDIHDANALISDYNYELNQATIGHKATGIFLLDKIGRLDAFPGVKEEHAFDEKETLKKLKHIAQDVPVSSGVQNYIAKAARKTKRTGAHQKLSFERRLVHWLVSNEKEEKRRSKLFLEKLRLKILELEAHIKRKPYDAANRNLYFGLLALCARLAHPEKLQEINTLKSELSGTFLKVRGEREIITLPGFSWGSSKPSKNAAFAWHNQRLFICIAASVKPFSVGEDSSHALRFIKTTGGSRKKAARKPKVISYVLGDFDTQAEGMPLFLPLSFGRSHARRYVTNKRWGLFSESPKVFLNNARLKRTKKNPGDSWQYFLDATLSADEKTFGFKEFQKDILKNAEAVIGIDRGEVNPIAYAVVDISGAVLKKGILGRKEYIEKLKAYDAKRKNQQSQGRLVSKGLRGKIARLQKTSLETAISEIIALAARHKAVIAIEDLGRNFPGAERSMIPKKTYKQVEDLLANALNFAGLLRMGTKGPIKYWGGLLQVIAAGTSQTCPQCNMRWRATRPAEKPGAEAAPFYAFSDIFTDARKQEFQNIDIKNKTITYKETALSLNSEWKTYSRWKPQGEEKTLQDFARAITDKKYDAVERLLAGALRCRPLRDVFICHACGFAGDADESAAIAIARRGIEKMHRLLTR